MSVRRLALIAVAGVGLRVLYTVLLSPWPPTSLNDQAFYHLEPILLAHGRGFIEPFYAVSGRTVPTAEHPPLYPLLLAGLAKLGGTTAMAQRLTGSVFGGVTIVATGLLGQRSAGARTGLLAAGLAAVYPILVTADGALMSESLDGMLIALALLSAWRLAEQPTVRRAVGFGVLVALAALTRGEALVLFVLLLAPLVRRPGGRRAGLAALAAVVVVLAPWTIRNAIVFHRLVVISNDLGAVIGGANCPPTYYGPQIGAWSFLCERVSAGNEAAQAARDQQAGLHYARHHLGRLPLVVMARLERLWGLREPFQTNEGRSPHAQDVGVVMYYLLLVPAVVGFIALRRRRASTWTLAAPIVSVTLVAAAGYGFMRMREPADVCLVVLAAVGAPTALGWCQGRLRGARG